MECHPQVSVSRKSADLKNKYYMFISFCQFIAQFQQFSFIFVENKATHNLKLFHKYLFILLATDYVKSKNN